MEMLSVGPPSVHERHRAKFHQKIGQMVVEIWRFNRFCKMAAVRHFGYVGRVLGAPAMTTIVLQNLAEIDAAVSII